ncbi:HAD hydrolase-like protein [Paenarthrobacter sp. NPDC018779]|uniref:HAD hydrolase-like protein n=1 Tax=Paenarthrobacter sp. NPDC018779 TaxID=3364375 RepID=UPI0037C8D477
MIRPQLHEPLQTEFTCVLFDMDGTLVDSAKGVTESAATALDMVGAEVPDPETLLTFVGPPMIESFRSLPGMTEERAQLALKHYRKAYADSGAKQAQLFHGVTEVLNQLGHRLPLAIATSKVEDQALRVAEFLGIDQHFVDICGASDANGRATKRDVIEESLQRLRTKEVNVDSPVMVGDRIYDVQGAAAFGIPTVFAQWGYGTQEEQAGAAAVACQPHDLIQLLSSDKATQQSVGQ